LIFFIRMAGGFVPSPPQLPEGVFGAMKLKTAFDFKPYKKGIFRHSGACAGKRAAAGDAARADCGSRMTK